MLTINRENYDLKMLEFTSRAKVILCEIQHLQVLEEKGIAAVFNRTVQNRMTWFTFAVNMAINVLYVSYYTWDLKSGLTSRSAAGERADELMMTTGTMDTGIKALNVVQVISSSFTLLLYLVVRAPVAYRVQMHATRSPWQAALAVGMDGYNWYYTIYVVSAICGGLVPKVGPIFNCILLFDIVVKNSTSRDVLLAVYIPRKQLAATLVLTMFTMYLFAFITFIGFPDDAQGDCESLSRCLALTIGFGLRNGGGIGDHYGYDHKAMGPRYAWDLLFFIVVLIILMNIIFGIIIDTFSELREVNKTRQEDTTEFCFICGEDKLYFAKGNGGPGFEHHIKNQHCLWAYLKFIIALELQSRDNDDGLEQYIRGCYEQDDITWFPEGRVLYKEELDAKAEEEAKALEKDNGMEKEFESRHEQTMMLLKKIAGNTDWPGQSSSPSHNKGRRQSFTELQRAADRQASPT